MDEQQGNPMEAGMPVLEPGAIKVFGVIHLVFAGLGVVMFLFSLIGLVAQKAMAGLMGASLKAGGGSAADEEAMKRMQELMTTMQDEMMVPTVVGMLFMLILSVLLLIAGRALVKKKKNAVAASNRYAFASIAFKVVALVLFFTITKAAQERYFENYTKFLEETGVPTTAGTTEIMNVTGAIGGVLSPILMMIYPILALVILNRPAVKEFLAKHGT